MFRNNASGMLFGGIVVAAVFYALTPASKPVVAVKPPVAPAVAAPIVEPVKPPVVAPVVTPPPVEVRQPIEVKIDVPVKVTKAAPVETVIEEEEEEEAKPAKKSKGKKAEKGDKSAVVGTYFKNCKAARAAGLSDMERDVPGSGYSPHLDRNNDGVACESR